MSAAFFFCFTCSLRPPYIFFLFAKNWYFVRPISIFIQMERRTAIKQLMFLTSGALLLPACAKQSKNASIKLSHLKISGNQEDLLAAVVDTIIPATDTPGAKELNVHQFILRMVDDCADPEQQKNFSDGLEAFDQSAEKKLGESFAEAQKDQRLAFLKELDQVKSSEGNEDAKKQPIQIFYSIAKDLTIRGYMSSEYVMTNLQYYTMVPGKFQGCVEVKNPNDYKTILG